jgi:hypothetical protein
MDGEKVEGADGPMVSAMESLALKVWRIFGGEIEWTALPWVAEMLGCDDIETLTDLLGTIRTHRYDAMKDA